MWAGTVCGEGSGDAACHLGEANHLICEAIGKGNHLSRISVTPEHPFSVQAQADTQPRPKLVGHAELNTRWVSAGHLQIGDKIKQADKEIEWIVYGLYPLEFKKSY
jgi:hypothetical protein